MDTLYTLTPELTDLISHVDLRMKIHYLVFYPSFKSSEQNVPTNTS